MDTTIAEADWVRPGPTRSAYRRDALVAAALMLGTGLSALLYSAVSGYPSAAWWVTTPWVVLIAGPLAFRRRYPATVSLVVAAAFMVGQLMLVTELLFSNICLFVALYSLGAWGRNRMRANVVRIAVVVGMFLWLFIALVLRANDPSSFAEAGLGTPGSAIDPLVALGIIQILQNLLYFGAAYYFGDSAFASARSRAVLEQRTLELGEERERSKHQAVALERLRIARELHDVVAHHVSVMGVQAGAARRLYEKDTDAAAAPPAPPSESATVAERAGGAGPDDGAEPAEARAANRAAVVASLTAIETNARSAVEELHRMLGTLRQPGDDAGLETEAGTEVRSDAGAGAGPGAEAGAGSGSGAGPGSGASESASTRGVAQLDELVGEVRSTGLDVTFQVVGEPREVPATIGLSVYRIAQEALTNTRKHAGLAARADVRLRYLADSLELEVSDTGSTRVRLGSSARAGRSGGLGQLGMRERVAAVGGMLELGPRSRGGYVVRARLPLAPAPTVRPLP